METTSAAASTAYFPPQKHSHSERIRSEVRNLKKILMRLPCMSYVHALKNRTFAQKFEQMQQNSGFENRFIDTYRPATESMAKELCYAPLFNPNDLTTLTVFPGIPAAPFSSAPTEKNPTPMTSVILPVALLLTAFLFVFLKNALKSSVGSLFLVGLFPKLLQETERRQIERNTVAIGLVTALSIFSLALVLYAFDARFHTLFPSFAQLNLPIPENFLYTTFFFIIVGVVFLFFYVRGGFILLFGDIFSASKTMRDYQKPYRMVFVSLLPVLFLVALFTAFAPFSVMNFMTFYLLASISIFYAAFVVQSLLKFANFINRYTIHIFLYLCTLEILPFLIVVKLMQNVGY